MGVNIQKRKVSVVILSLSCGFDEISFFGQEKIWWAKCVRLMVNNEIARKLIHFWLWHGGPKHFVENNEISFGDFTALEINEHPTLIILVFCNAKYKPNKSYITCN